MTIAYRIEWERRGPFWHDATLKNLVRLCRKLTPAWKQHDSTCSTFFEHYCATADSPYDNKEFDRHLSRLRENDSSLGFGFLSVDGLRKALGLSDVLYREQFRLLLEEQSSFRVRAYLCDPLAQSLDEVLFRWSSAELLDEVSTWSEFVAF